HLDLKEKTFDSQVELYPWLAPLRELRGSLSGMRLESLAVGHDGFNRTSLFPFATKTSRNAPSTSKFIFGLSAWLRSLIKPQWGHAVFYIDWRAQEIAVAAWLSGDTNLEHAYLSGDPYLSFGKQAGVVPADATKASHPIEREQCKAVFLAIGYGQSDYGLA